MLKESLTSNNGQIMERPCLLIPQVFKDDRGFFLESWNHKVFINTVEWYIKNTEWAAEILRRRFN